MRRTLPLFIAALVAAGATTAQARENYIEDDSNTGSHIGHRAVTGGIPFDKSWAQLDARERAMFLSVYQNFPSADEPPFPTKGLQVIYEPIYRAHQKLGRRGEIFAIAMVDAEGRTETVAVYKSPDQHMTEVVQAILFQTEFKPPRCAGKPCKMEFPVQIKLAVDY